MNNSRRKKILIVDDEQRILDSLHDLLEDEFDVMATSDPREGLELLKEHRVGVVISDQRMPQMAGHEFLSEVSKICGATRMLITGYTDIDALASAVNRSQIFAYITKPWDPTHLKSMVQTAMEHYGLVEDLNYERHLLAQLMKTVPDPIVFLDKVGTLLRVNDMAVELLGFESREEAEGRTVGQATGASVGIRELLSVIPEGRRKIVQVSEGEGRERWFSTVQVPFGEDEGIISVSHDVTDQHLTEVELARKARELDRSYREIHQFAHVTAHHLQEPLRDVVSHLQLLGRRSELSEENQELLEFAIGGARRMKLLFSDFIRYIDFDKGSREPEKVDLGELIQSVLWSRKRTLAEMGAARMSADRFPVVEGYRPYLRYMFEELVENCIKFHHGGELEVGIRCEENPTEWLVVVEDNGPGVEPDEKERIFGLFQRLHGMDAYEGTGLGLALCRRIAHLHGGRIWAESDGPGSGLSVTISFPRRQR